MSAGANNIKVASVTDLSSGQMIVIDAGLNQETAIIATVGTQGAATIGAAITSGTTVIPLDAPAGFIPGQTITIDGGVNVETAVVISSSAGGRGGGGRGGQAAGPSVTVAAPLARTHPAGALVSGTGITIAGALNRAHASGVEIAGGIPTPGAPNVYRKKN